MEEKEQSFEYAVSVDADKAASYLESVARYVRSGMLSLSAGAESIDLQVGTEMKLEIAAEQKLEKGKGSLQVELSWKIPTAKEEGEIKIAGGQQAGSGGV